MLARTLSVFAIGLAAVLFVCDVQARGSRPDTSAEPLTTQQTQPPTGGTTPSQPPSQGKAKDSGKSKDANKAKDSSKGKDAKGKGGKGKPNAGGFGPGGFGKGGFGKGGFGKGDFKKKDEPKKDEPKKDTPLKSLGKGPAFGGKLDPETIKTKYEFYKKLYEESQKEAASATVEARIDRLINELQALRNEVRAKKK